jgi:L-lactate dehydrogenase
VRRAAPEVVERKGNTAYAIASCVTRICEAILRDEHTVLAVSALMQGEYGVEGVYLGTPCVVGRKGIEMVIELPLSETELNDLRASAEVLRKTLQDSQKGESKGSGKSA